MTGATGFVGSHLMPLLRARFGDGAAIAARCDITDEAAVSAEIASVLPDALVHLAAVASIPAASRDPDLAWQVNLGGTLTLARAVLRHVPTARLLFVSSGDSYGAAFRAGVPVDETAALAPLNAYAATKAAADLALGAMVTEGLQVIRARPLNHTGPGQSETYVVGAFARQIARIALGLAEPVLRVGDLSAIRDFLDVRDVCAAYAACLDTVLPAGTILNIASGEPRRIGDILHGLLGAAGVSARIEVDPARLRPADIVRAQGDGRLARRLLGWSPSIPWAQTLSDCLADWRERERGGIGE